MGLEELIEEIKSCKLCESIVFNGSVNVGEKPYIKHEVYEERIPDTIVFIYS